MYELNHNNLNISLDVIRIAYTAFYAYTNDGEMPSPEKIELIQTHADYSAVITPVRLDSDFAEYVSSPLKQRKKLEYLQLALFALLVVTQVRIIWLKK